MMKEFVVSIDVFFEAETYTEAQEYADFIVDGIRLNYRVNEVRREHVEEDDG